MTSPRATEGTSGLLSPALLIPAILFLYLMLPGCGGGGGGGNSQQTLNPVPTITTLSPSSATAGAAAQTLTINGTNFLSTSTVTYNGAGQATTFVSATQLTISLSASDQATAGSYPVVVTNPSPGGGLSNAVNFTVNAATNAVQISSLSEATANPFDSLTITGTGFSAGIYAISVWFIPENGDASIMVPVSGSNSTSVQAMVPPFIGSTSGTFTPETVDVQIVEFSSTTTYLSNRITGLQVNTLPAVPNGVPVGAMTGALLSSTLNISGATLTAQANNTTFANTATALSQLNADLVSLTTAVNAVTDNPAQGASVTTANGATTTLNATTLALSDQLAQALIAAVVNQGSIPTATSPDCPTSGNATYDGNLCSVQIYFQTLAAQVSATPALQQQPRNVTALAITPPQAAVLTLYANLTLAMLSDWALPGGGPVIYQLAIAPVVTTFITSFAINHETPSGEDVTERAGLNFLDNAFFAGAPILGTTVDEIRALQAIVNWSPPQKGILLSSGAAASVSGGVTFLDPETGAPTTLLKVPVQNQAGTFDTTTLVIPPQPTPYTLTISVVGPGTGSVNSFPSGTTFPAGTVVALTAIPAFGSTFGGWSGACSGTGTCTTTMNQSQSVTATFDQSSAYTGSFAAPFSSTFPDPAGDTYGASLSGTITLDSVQNSNGAITGSASVPVNINITVVSCPAGNCTTTPGSGTATGSVSGNAANLSGTFTTGCFTMTFTGTLSGTSITGSAVFSSCFTGTSNGTSISTTLSGSIPSITLSEQ